MIKIIPHLTCNQAMVLLDIYRGTFEPSRHIGVIYQDLLMLVFHQYIAEDNECAYIMTNHGENRVREMLC